jgi:hypothetical protein
MANLASVLHKSGKLNDRQATVIRERAANTGDKALALLLIQANYVTQADIVTSVRQHTLDIVYDLQTWDNGRSCSTTARPLPKTASPSQSSWKTSLSKAAAG